MAAQKEKVLIAAAQVFSKTGFDVASLDEIAARVGLKKLRLYFHFKHKREILEACVERAICQWRNAIAGIEENSSGETTLKSIIERTSTVLRLFVIAPFHPCHGCQRRPHAAIMSNSTCMRS